MGSDPTVTQGTLFDQGEGGGEGTTVIINNRCRIQTLAGYRVVSAGGIPLAGYVVEDRMSEAYAMVLLVEQGWALQNEVASAFGCSERTVRRNQRRLESQGIAALGRPKGFPQGTSRLPASKTELVENWAAEGVPNRKIARILGVSEKAVRNLLRRLGWKPKQAEQISLDVESESADPKLSGSAATSQTGAAQAPRDTVQESSPGADPKLSGSAAISQAGTAQTPKLTMQEPPSGADPKLSGSGAAGAAQVPRDTVQEPSPGADPGLSGSLAAPTLPIPATLDTDPSDRCIDRVLASHGLIDDAAPLFRPGTGVPGAGVLLAIPALVESRVFDIATEVYGSIGPAFYGLRTTMVTLLMMALLRIKRPETLKEHSPGALGRVLGLDRAPEVKTLRRKLARLAASGLATDFGRALATHRVVTRGHAMGFLYCDGHVRAYHGKHSLPKAHLARMRLSMPATTDYWINDSEGEPLFVVTVEANEGLVKALVPILDEVRLLVGDRRVTIVFDRGGWSPKLFSKLIASGFDILTYRKGRFRRVPLRCFTIHVGSFEGREVEYLLADQGIYLHHGIRDARRRLHLRQVTRLGDDGHQTPIITSRRDLTAVEVAYRMFGRWRQENFFKYLRQEFALDALVDYDVESADASRDVPNPERKKINTRIRNAYNELSLLAADYGAEAFDSLRNRRHNVKEFKKANAPLTQRISEVLELIRALEKKRASIPTRIPVRQVTPGEVVKLSVERKHLTDLLKMVAFQAESDLLRLVTPHYRRSEDEGRTLIQNALTAAGDIEVTDQELHVILDPLSSPHRTYALIALCEELSATETLFPGSRLRLCFKVKPEQDYTLAFPGPRSSPSSGGVLPDK